VGVAGGDDVPAVGQRFRHARAVRGRRDRVETAGQDQRRHLEGAQIGHHRADFMKIQLAGEILVGRGRITMPAQQIAPPNQIPDHHWTGRIAPGADRTGILDFA